MADVTAGQILGKNGAANREDLGLKVYMEVMEAFQRKNVFKSLVYSQTIDAGVSGQFIVGGKDIATDLTKLHTAGADILTNATSFNERIITLGQGLGAAGADIAGTGGSNLIYDARHINGLEEKLSHYDVRSPVTNMIGSTLSHKVDLALYYQLLKAAGYNINGTASGLNTGLAGNPDSAGAILNAAITGAATVAAQGNAFVEAIYEAAAAIWANDVTAEIYCAVTPAGYNKLVQSDRMVDGDFTSGNGGLDTGIVKMVGNVPIIKTNNIQQPTGSTGVVEAIMFTRESVGWVDFMGLMTSSFYDENKFGTTLTGRFAAGTGVLRPETTAVIVSAAITA